MPSHQEDARCLRCRIFQTAADTAQPGSTGWRVDQRAVKPGGRGTASGIADGLQPMLGEWSLPLSMGRRQASSGSWRVLAAAAMPSAATLPSPGTSSLVHIPSGLPRSTASAAATEASVDGTDGQRQQLTATLAAQELFRGCSAVTYLLLPHGVLHNCTGRDLVLKDPESATWSAAAMAGSNTAFSNGNPAVPPEQVCTATSHPVNNC